MAGNTRQIWATLRDMVHDPALTRWEADFCRSLLQRLRGTEGAYVLSEKQISVVERMRAKCSDAPKDPEEREAGDLISIEHALARAIDGVAQAVGYSMPRPRRRASRR